MKTILDRLLYTFYCFDVFTSNLSIYIVIKLVSFFHLIHADFIGNWLGEATGLNSRLKEIIRLSDLERLTGEKNH